jgi:hypothetical protein
VPVAVVVDVERGAVDDAELLEGRRCRRSPRRWWCSTRRPRGTRRGRCRRSRCRSRARGRRTAATRTTWRGATHWVAAVDRSPWPSASQSSNHVGKVVGVVVDAAGAIVVDPVADLVGEGSGVAGGRSASSQSSRNGKPSPVGVVEHGGVGVGPAEGADVGRAAVGVLERGGHRRRRAGSRTRATAWSLPQMPSSMNPARRGSATTSVAPTPAGDGGVAGPVGVVVVGEPTDGGDAGGGVERETTCW